MPETIERRVVLVCGGRDYDNRDAVWGLLDSHHQYRPFDLLLHGGAAGADTLAGLWAADRGVPVKEYPADWRRYGRSAGPRRNQQMLTEGRPTLLIHFPGGYGTSDMVRRAVDAGVRVSGIWDPKWDATLPGGRPGDAKKEERG